MNQRIVVQSIKEFLKKTFLPGLIIWGDRDRSQRFRDKSLGREGRRGQGQGTEFKTSKA